MEKPALLGVKIKEIQLTNPEMIPFTTILTTRDNVFTRFAFIPVVWWSCCDALFHFTLADDGQFCLFQRFLLGQQMVDILSYWHLKSAI